MSFVLSSVAYSRVPLRPSPLTQRPSVRVSTILLPGVECPLPFATVPGAQHPYHSPFPPSHRWIIILSFPNQPYTLAQSHHNPLLRASQRSPRTAPSRARMWCGHTAASTRLAPSSLSLARRSWLPSTLNDTRMIQVPGYIRKSLNR